MNMRDLLNLFKGGNVMSMIIKPREVAFQIDYSFRGGSAFSASCYLSVNKKIYIEDIR